MAVAGGKWGHLAELLYLYYVLFTHLSGESVVDNLLYIENKGLPVCCKEIHRIHRQGVHTPPGYQPNISVIYQRPADNTFWLIY